MVFGCSIQLRGTIFSTITQIKMQNEVLFKLKVQGTFTREGFIPCKDAKVITITKFVDGTYVAKSGNKVIIDRYKRSVLIEKYISNFIQF